MRIGECVCAAQVAFVSIAHSCIATQCAGGYFQPQAGASACYKCTTERGPEYDSPTRATNCTRCLMSFFMDDDGICQICPTGVDCARSGSTLAGLWIKPWYYRFSADSTLVYKCPKGADCIGGNFTGERLCSRAAKGHLCSACEVNHYVRNAVEACTECGDVNDLW